MVNYMYSEKEVEVYYEQLLEFLISTKQTYFATRADCVAYSIGYYGFVTPNCWEAIKRLYQDMYINP